MSNLEKARARIAAEKAKMYELSTSADAGMQILISHRNVMAAYSTLSPEDRAILIAEETALLVD